MSQRISGLVWLLRVLGAVNFAAAVAVVAPRAWLAGCHEFLGLGPFPTAPIAGYLARTTSLWFASFGILLWFVARDIPRYSQVIAFLGWAMVIQGGVVFAIDCCEGLPLWWIAIEGPTCLLLGVSMLWLRSLAPNPSEREFQ